MNGQEQKTPEEHPLNQEVMEILRELEGLEEEDPDPPLELYPPVLALFDRMLGIEGVGSVSEKLMGTADDEDGRETRPNDGTADERLLSRGCATGQQHGVESEGEVTGRTGEDQTGAAAESDESATGREVIK